MSRAPHPTGRGAAGVITPQDAKPAPSEHDRDVALAAAAKRHVLARMAAKRRDGEQPPPWLRNAATITTGLLRDLSATAWNVLTDRQREMCARWAGLDQVPPAEKTVPEVLRVLPKSPPGRRT